MKTVGPRSGLMVSGSPKSTILNNFGLLLEVEIPNIKAARAISKFGRFLLA